MRRRLITIAIVVVALALALWFLLQGANRPADPYFRGPVEHFGRQAFSIESFLGERATGNTRCALLAVTEEQLSRGLMGRRDLAGYDGMIFRFASDADRPFTMRATLIPLSIAWFDGEGRFVAQAEMRPCRRRLSCPSYSPGRPYRYALEVRAGGLPALGAGPGSHLTLGGTCV